MLNAMARFRWLIVAIDQNADGIAEIFCQWRKYRLNLRPGLQGLDLRRYYHTLEFCSDFRSFVRQHSIAEHAAVRTMLDFEDAMRDSILQDRSVTPAGSLVAPGCQLWWSDIPVKKAGTTMIEFPGDIQMLIQELRRESGPAFPSHCFYLRSEVSPGMHKIEQISDWLACLLRASDGRRNIGEVVEELHRDIPELQESLREYAFVQLLAGAQKQGFIEIHRPSPDEHGG